jgi:hypothetical protein
MSLATRVQLVDELLAKLAKSELGEENARQVKRYGDARARAPWRARSPRPLTVTVCFAHLAPGMRGLARLSGRSTALRLLRTCDWQVHAAVCVACP